jgi:two-component system response regulator
VLLDLYLGDATGFEVLQQMKITVELALIPVVVLSGSRDVTDIARSYALRATSFVAKPLDPPRHLAAVLSGAAWQAPETEAP